MNVDKYIKSLKVKVDKISEKQFKSNVYNVFKDLTSIHKLVRNQVKSYLITNQGRTITLGGVSSQIPRVRTGNLVKNVAEYTGRTREKAPVRSKVGDVVKYSFTNYWSADADILGNHTVLSKKGKRPYAYFLDTLPQFSKYNNFLDITNNAYGNLFNQGLQKSISKRFDVGTYRF